MNNTTNRHIYGIDEAGRGCLAGPLVVAAVEYPFRGLQQADMEDILLDDFVKDSKALSPKQREGLYLLITPRVRYSCVFIASHAIDKHGIQWAEAIGAKGAIETLLHRSEEPVPEAMVFDGTPQTWTLGSDVYNFEYVIRGDKTVPAISAASIIAKVERDHYMQILHALWPYYRFDTHKGYGTPQHLALLEQHGSCSEHRHTFAPVKERDARL